MQQLRDRVARLIQDGEVEGFLGLVDIGGHPMPTLLTTDNLDELLPLLNTGGDIRYPLVKTLIKIAKRHPESRLGVMVRGCDEKALTEIYKSEQLSKEKIVPVGLACSRDLAEGCECSKPYTDAEFVGEKAEPITSRKELERIEAMERDERLAFWRDEFSRCIKCYGCRNICHLCFCENCTLEDGKLMEAGAIPVSIPGWHALRAFHTAGRCIDCGACEEACPMEIPLRTLYRKVRQIYADMLGFVPGEDPETKPPFEVLGDGTFEVPADED